MHNALPSEHSSKSRQRPSGVMAKPSSQIQSKLPTLFEHYAKIFNIEKSLPCTLEFCGQGLLSHSLISWQPHELVFLWMLIFFTSSKNSGQYSGSWNVAARSPWEVTNKLPATDFSASAITWLTSRSGTFLKIFQTLPIFGNFDFLLSNENTTLRSILFRSPQRHFRKVYKIL